MAGWQAGRLEVWQICSHTCRQTSWHADFQAFRLAVWQAGRLLGCQDGNLAGCQPDWLAR